jgi:ribonuclease VapC
MLAFLQAEEPVAMRVRQLLFEAQSQKANLYISIINLGEIYYRVGKVRGAREAEQMLDDLRLMPITIKSVDDADVLVAANLKMSYTISYADAFAVTLAQKLSAILITGDPEIEQLQDVIPLERLQRARK